MFDAGMMMFIILGVWGEFLKLRVLGEFLWVFCDGGELWFFVCNLGIFWDEKVVKKERWVRWGGES